MLHFRIKTFIQERQSTLRNITITYKGKLVNNVYRNKTIRYLTMGEKNKKNVNFAEKVNEKSALIRRIKRVAFV